MTAAQPTPVAVTNRGWSIGDAGRAFAEVEPVLGDLNEGPDTMADGGVVGSVHVLAASVRGLSHRQQGTPRQDSYGFAVTADRRWLVLTVADGVSAGRLSHRAAQLVTRYGPGLVAAEIDREGAPWNVPWYEIFQQLAGRIISVGQKLLAAEGIPDATPQGVSDAMATTVTVVVMELAPVEGTRRVAVAWQGDSPVWLVYRDEWRCLTEVKNLSKELASSSVMALPRLPSDPDMLRHTATMVPLDATLLVMTDGVGDPLGTADGDVAAALAEAWHTPPTVFRFAEQVAFGRKSFDDDRTVVAVWPRTAS
ncbi:MAG TPA: protein phosphatase 2C domain-containing protein [Kribbellaceae bacterium]|nr:protein phosphatase 2C domain-containing protein [Kribbellaceae bacterium]